jgi:hypothetical protein
VVVGVGQDEIANAATLTCAANFTSSRFLAGMEALQLAFLYRRDDSFASELLEELVDLPDENKLKCAS